MYKNRSIDSNFLIRFFYFHCFLHIYRVLTYEHTPDAFTPPRFTLFKKIVNKFTQGHNFLFKNLLWTFKWHVLMGAGITIVFASFNLLVPELIRMFMHFMHEHHSEKRQVSMASNFIRTLVAVQIIRLVFGQHTKRIFHELAIKVQSSLARMLVEKSLRLTQQARKDIPQSEIIQLQNVDLKLAFTLFNNLYLLFQAPFTIIIAILMLFYESKTYGFIGIYWFLIAFLLHRQLDEKMTHCNSTKLGLIQARSKVNYQMLDCIKEAKIIGWEDVLIEKNNDLFQEENHDHQLFYRYNSLYDIILLMLPVLVVVTICVYDLGEERHITVEQVYLMLSLLELCYDPMKSFRTLSISFHDGLHSLNRIAQYLNMPEHIPSELINKNIEKGHVVIQEDTLAMYPGSVFDFYIQIKHHVEINAGDRLILAGRKGNGRTSFMNMLTGYMEKVSGQVKIRGPIAYLSEHHFFTKNKIIDNIMFFDEKVSKLEIQHMFDQFGLADQLKKIGGLNAKMDDLNLFTKSQLQKIALLRVVCSNASIYLMDMPFMNLDEEFERKLDLILRKKQFEQNVTIIMGVSYLDHVESRDKILIISKGETTEYGRYDQLILNKTSDVYKFFSSIEDEEEIKSTGKKSSKKNSTITKFQRGVQKITAMNTALKGFSAVIGGNQSGFKFGSDSLIKSVFQNLLKAKVQEKITKQNQRKNVSFRKYLKQFLLAAHFSETIFILIIIACAQLLHVFIHYWIGHLEEDHGENSFLNFHSMIVIQVILTFGLASVLYYEGEVSSMIAIIQGNKMYQKSIVNLANKDIEWFTNEYSVKIADKFNHDYEEVFIACHSVLGIYKNIIILIVTIRFISSDGFSLVVMFSVIAGLYFSILWLFRTVQRQIVKHFYDFKYEYVRNLEESIQGSDYFHIYEKQSAILHKTEVSYKRFASYKLAQRYNGYGLSIVSDLMSVFLLAGAVSYGLQMKIHNTGSNIAMIATVIHLLMNGSQVLKNIVKETVAFQSFFLINLIPFLEVKYDKGRSDDRSLKQKDTSPHMFDILLDRTILREPQNPAMLHPITMKIPQGQIMMIYAPSDAFRNLFLYSFTNNHTVSEEVWEDQRAGIEIGGVNIDDIPLLHLRQLVGVIMARNFYMSGTLRDNLVRKMKASDSEIDKYVKMLKLDEDIEDYDFKGLDSHITFQNNKVNNQITKKFAIIRILLKKSRIIIIKDTPSFIGSKSIVDICRKYIPGCTIIKLSNKIEAGFDVDRIVNIDSHIVLEDGSPLNLLKKKNSIVGGLLTDANLQGYLYMNKVSRVVKPKGFLKKLTSITSPLKTKKASSGHLKEPESSLNYRSPTLINAESPTVMKALADMAKQK